MREKITLSETEKRIIECSFFLSFVDSSPKERQIGSIYRMGRSIRLKVFAKVFRVDLSCRWSFRRTHATLRSSAAASRCHYCGRRRLIDFSTTATFSSSPAKTETDLQTEDTSR